MPTIIEGLLRHCTDAESDTNYVDTQGANVALTRRCTAAEHTPYPPRGVPREHIHIDTASGAKASRPRLDLVLNMLHGGAPSS